MLAHPNTAYEFLAQGLSPRQQPLAQRTPRKYIVSKWITVGGDVTLEVRAEEVLIRYRKLCIDDHDAGLVPTGGTASGDRTQEGRHGC